MIFYFYFILLNGMFSGGCEIEFNVHLSFSGMPVHFIAHI